MTSLRFGFTVILLVLLMIINAATFVRKDYKGSVERYREKTAGSLGKLKANCSSLYTLMTEGPGDLYKKPSPLTFCADGGEKTIPDVIWARGSWGGTKSWSGPSYSYATKGLWLLKHYTLDLDRVNIMPGYLKTDWAFIIGVLVSFVGILFTFDAISGEKERGTLRLILAGTVPRSSVILAKFAGAVISILLPLSIAILLSLLIINVSGAVELDAGHWSRIGVIALISAVYIAIFVCLGIFVSTCCSRSRTSLLTLLLIWIVFVVLVPNILGSISSGLKKVSSTDEISRLRQTAIDDLWNGYQFSDLFPGNVVPSRKNPDMKVIELWADLLNRDLQIREKITDEHLDDQLAQIRLARQITRISPTAIYRYALESLSDSGFERHRKFIANARAYRNRVWEYIKSEDRKDPNSLHLYFVREGISDKPPNSDNAPRFAENLTLAGALHDSLLDIAILLLFAVFFFMAAYISFIRADVR